MIAEPARRRRGRPRRRRTQPRRRGRCGGCRCRRARPSSAGRRAPARSDAPAAAGATVAATSMSASCRCAVAGRVRPWKNQRPPMPVRPAARLGTIASSGAPTACCDAHMPTAANAGESRLCESQPAAGDDAEHCGEHDAEGEDADDERHLVVLTEGFDGEVLHRTRHPVDHGFGDGDDRRLPRAPQPGDELADAESGGAHGEATGCGEQPAVRPGRRPIERRMRSHARAFGAERYRDVIPVPVGCHPSAAGSAANGGQTAAARPIVRRASGGSPGALR